MVDKFEEMIDQSMAEVHSVGSTVKGKVVQINEDGIYVDIGTKSEGILEYNKIIPEDIPDINIGDIIEAKIVSRKDGVYYLSKKALDFERGWNQLKKDFDSQQPVMAKIVRKVSNGYFAEAFRVASGFLHDKNFQTPPQIGDVVDVIVSEYNAKTKKVMFTRKPLILAEKKKRQDDEYQNLQIGVVMDGKVEKVSPFGVFVRISGHVVGLLHISEMSHDHIKFPGSVCKVGDTLKVRVISIDRETGRVGLSHKDTYTDPILDVVEGEDYDAVVESLTDFGAFVRLPSTVVGLVHISEVSFTRFEKVSDVLRNGMKVRVKVLNVNIRDRRVSLSIKALEQDPWLAVYEKFGVGERVDVTVKEIGPAGMVVKLSEAFEGFIPISEISHERIEHPSKLYSVGDSVKAQVINVDSLRRKIKLSIRQTLERYSSDEAGYAGPVSAADAKPTGTPMTFGDLLSKSGIVGSEPEAAPEVPVPDEEPAVDDVVGEPEASPEEPVADDVGGEPEAVPEEPVADDVGCEPEAAPKEPAADDTEGEKSEAG